LAVKAKAGIVHSVSGWMRAVQVKLWDPWERVPYLSPLDVWSWQGVIQIHIYLYKCSKRKGWSWQLQSCSVHIGCRAVWSWLSHLVLRVT